MSEKKMKALRKKIYGNMAYRKEKHLTSNKGQIINLHRVSYRKAKHALKNK